MNGKPWTAAEDALIRENPDMAASVIAEKIDRTTQAVRHRKSQLGVHVTENWTATGSRKPAGRGDHDTRPSGWYVETIGTLLLDYEDVFSTWKHYHKYVEVKRTGIDDRRGYTTLLCRRNAIAP